MSVHALGSWQLDLTCCGSYKSLRELRCGTKPNTTLRYPQRICIRSRRISRFPLTGVIILLLTFSLHLPLSALWGLSSAQRQSKRQTISSTVVTPVIINLQRAVKGSDSLCSYCRRSICEWFSFQKERESGGKICTAERERERNSTHGRKPNGLTRIFAQRSETAFDLPLSCIGFGSSAWKGRTPLNQHHLLWWGICVCASYLPFLPLQTLGEGGWGTMATMGKVRGCFSNLSVYATSGEVSLLMWKNVKLSCI